MSRDDIEKELRVFYASVDAMDFDKALTYFTDDATFIFPGIPPMKGKEAIRAFYDEIKQNNTSMEHVLLKVIIDGNAAAFELLVKMTSKDGKTEEMLDVNIMELTGNKISKVQLYFDIAPN